MQSFLELQLQPLPVVRALPPASTRMQAMREATGGASGCPLAEVVLVPRYAKAEKECAVRHVRVGLPELVAAPRSFEAVAQSVLVAEEVAVVLLPQPLAR